MKKILQKINRITSLVILLLILVTIITHIDTIKNNKVFAASSYEMISVATDGTHILENDGSHQFAMSHNGRYFVFTKGTNTTYEVYLRDRQTGITQYVGESGSIAQFPAVSDDGRYVAFQSNSENILPNISGPQVYVRDMQTGAILLASAALDNSPQNGSYYQLVPRISSDGRYVVFSSNATNLVSGVTGNQIYVHDMQSGTNSLVTIGSDGSPKGGDMAGSISSDGRYITFYSHGNNLVNGVSGGQSYLRDMQNGITELISKSSSGIPGNGDSAAIIATGTSPDQRYVVFQSYGSTNLVTGITGNQIYLRDRQTGTTELISKSTEGTPANISVNWPSVSADGRFVTYYSSATTLVPGISEPVQAIYIFDRQTSVTKRVDLTTDGIFANNDSFSPQITGDGNSIAFYSYASNFLPGVGVGEELIYLTSNPFAEDNSPSINPLTGGTINEGDTYTENGSFTDTDSSSWTATVDYGDGSGVQPLIISGNNFSLSHIYKDNGSFSVEVSITDNQGKTGMETTTVTVYNVQPSVSSITAPMTPTLINTSLSANAPFSDPGILDTHTAVWNWGDNSTSSGTVTETNGSGTVTGSHSYTAAGVYTVSLTVTDKDNSQGSSVFNYVVIYNTATKSVTGLKEFTSPSGALVSNPGISGTADFGFTAEYDNNGNVIPIGNKWASLTFKVGNTTYVDFNATQYQSLVVSGSKVTLQGTGSYNGNAGYTVLITAIDGTISGGRDFVRYQIKTSTGTVVYDTQSGAALTADPTTLVTKGKITVK